MKKYLSLLLLFSSPAFSGLTLDNLSQSDVDSVSKEFAADFAHTILAPASAYGKIFGFELGLVGGATKTPNIEQISKKFSTSSNVSNLPSAGLIAGASIPFGVSAELSLVPKIEGSNVSFQNTSGAIKWTFTSLFSSLPFDAAVRIHGNSSTFSYSSVINNASTSNQNVNTNTSWKSKTIGYNAEISKKFLFVEPYAGIGYIKATTDIGVSANSSVSIFNFSSASNYTAKNSGMHVFTGLNLNLFLVKFGAEYSRILSTSKFMGKLSFYF